MNPMAALMLSQAGRFSTFFLIGVLASVVAAVKHEPEYRSGALLEVYLRAASETARGVEELEIDRMVSALRRHKVRLESVGLRQRVVEAAPRGLLAEDDRLPFEIPLSWRALVRWLRPAMSVSEDGQLVHRDQRHAALEKLAEHIVIREVPFTNNLIIEASGSSPESAAILANLMARTYLGWTVETEQRRSRERLAFLDERLALAQQTSDGYTELLARHRLTHRFKFAMREHRHGRSASQELEGALHWWQLRDKLSSSSDQIRKLLPPDVTSVQADAAIHRIMTSAGAAKDLARLRSTYERQLMKTILLNRTEAGIETDMGLAKRLEARLLSVVQTALTADPLSALADHGSLVPVIRDYLIHKTELEAGVAIARVVEDSPWTVQELSVPYDDKFVAQIERELRLVDELQLDLKKRRQEVLLAMSKTTPDAVSILSQAQAPFEPVRARWEVLLLGMTASAVIAFGLCAARYLRTSSPRTSEQWARSLGVPVLGMLPQGASVVRAAHGAGGQCVELERLAAALERECRPLVVASARRGEGTSTVAAALAATLARRRAATLVSARQQATGVVAGLWSKVKWAVTARTRKRLSEQAHVSSARLTLSPEHPSGEILQTDRGDMLDPGAGPLIVECAALREEVTAAEVARRLEADVLLVVSARHTPVGVVRDALLQLERLGAPVRGVIVNRRIYELPEWLYLRVGQADV